MKALVTFMARCHPQDEAFVASCGVVVPANPLGHSEFWLLAQLREGLSGRNLRLALGDIRRGWQRRELWGTMGMHDIRQRYRRSVIGPFWLTLSMGIFIAALGLLYAGILKQPLATYLPYVAAGFIVWGLISTLILDGTQTFIANEGMIRQLPAPLSLYVYRTIWSNLIIFAHNAVIFAVVALWFGINPGWVGLFALPALAVLAVNGVWMGLLLGLLSARFRDVPQILASLVQVMFFLSPIIWRPEMLPGRTLIVDWNPFYHLVELVRSPLLGQLPAPSTLVFVAAVTVCGWVTMLFFYTVYRWRIAYWV
jgi:ABC-2 type transport system permease protein